MMNQESQYNRVVKRVSDIKGFYKHLLVYVLVNCGLFVINQLTGGTYWFYWPLLGWGMAVAIHAIRVFLLGDFLGPDWEEKKINELINKHK